MVKKIISISDIHIRNFKRLEETGEVLDKFIKACKRIVSKYDKDEVRIVIAGDLFNNKIEVSNEANVMAGYLIRNLNDIAKTIIISGNHDLLINNKSRLDTLSQLISLIRPDNTIFLDKELQYESGCYVDDNIVWCLYSSFDDFNKPNIEEYKEKYPDKTYVGLFHGTLNGARNDKSYIMDKGLSPQIFSPLDFAIIGHIHKHQCITINNTKLVYCGSILQQDFGESISGHGYVVWDVENKTYKQYDINNSKYGLYHFSIKNIDDIDNDKEALINN